MYKMNSTVIVDGGSRHVRRASRPSKRMSNSVVASLPIVTVAEEDDEDEDEMQAVDAHSTDVANASHRSNCTSLSEGAAAAAAAAATASIQHRTRRIAVVDSSESARIVHDDEKLLAAGSTMSSEARLSLLGRPIGLQRYRASRRDAEIRRIQAKVYNFLERPKEWPSIAYHVTV